MTDEILSKNFLRKVISLDEDMGRYNLYDAFIESAAQMKKNGMDELAILEIIEKIYWAAEQHFC